MITTTDVVTEIVRRTPFLEVGLLKGLVNLSALARDIQPEVEQRLMKPVGSSAIMMALKRLELPEGISLQSRDHVLGQIGNMTVRSNLKEFTYANSDSVIKRQAALLKVAAERTDTFLTVTQGVHETTLFASAVLAADIEQLFADEKLLSRFDNLSSITLKLPKEAVQTPGIHYLILKQLAWENISIVDNVSTYTEFTVILHLEYVDRAFKILADISGSRT